MMDKIVVIVINILTNEFFKIISTVRSSYSKDDSYYTKTNDQKKYVDNYLNHGENQAYHSQDAGEHLEVFPVLVVFDIPAFHPLLDFLFQTQFFIPSPLRIEVFI